MTQPFDIDPDALEEPNQPDRHSPNTFPPGELLRPGAGAKLFPLGGWSIGLWCVGLFMAVIALASPGSAGPLWGLLAVALVLIAISPVIGFAWFARWHVAIGEDGVIVHRPPSRDRVIPFAGITRVEHYAMGVSLARVIAVYYADPRRPGGQISPFGLNATQRLHVWKALTAHASAQPHSF
ncbi:MAG: hypothetical protein LBM66_04390 [Bifidobacteriaceae bacterium]|nr:hypothetical protein [Bifidobacteriaceae bacterium]